MRHRVYPAAAEAAARGSSVRVRAERVPGSQSGLDRDRRRGENGANDANLGKLRFVYGHNALKSRGRVGEVAHSGQLLGGAGGEGTGLSDARLLRTVVELRFSQDMLGARGHAALEHFCGRGKGVCDPRLRHDRLRHMARSCWRARAWEMRSQGR